jgi:diguanylate cyclase (GGDEF)-like protein
MTEFEYLLAGLIIIMFITVMYRNGKIGMVDLDQLDNLIQSGKVRQFMRGDEFVVMPIETKGANLDIVINRLQKAVETDNAKTQRDYKLSISAGTAHFDPSSPCTIDELLSRADRAMHEQKRSKRTASRQ